MSTSRSNRAPLVLVVAMSRNRVIGKDGGMPWHEPEDLKHFKRVTMGHALIMGRRTWDSIGRPLPGRLMIVITSQDALALPDGVERAKNLPHALSLARLSDAEPHVIGGGQIYLQALDLATRIELTVIDRDIEGDTYFPELDPNDWQEIARQDRDGLSFRTLVLKTPPAPSVSQRQDDLT